MQVPHARVQRLVLESVGVALPLLGPLVRRRAQRLAAFELHHFVQQQLQHLSQAVEAVLSTVQLGIAVAV